MSIILATQEAEINQEDHGSKLARGNSARDPISEIPITHTQKGLEEREELG
jgi:hypothetical protein